MDLSRLIGRKTESGTVGDTKAEENASTDVSSLIIRKTETETMGNTATQKKLNQVISQDGLSGKQNG